MKIGVGASLYLSVEFGAPLLRGSELWVSAFVAVQVTFGEVLKNQACEQ